MSHESRYRQIFERAFSSTKLVLENQGTSREKDTDIARRQREIKNLEHVLEGEIERLIENRRISSMEDIDALCSSVDDLRDRLVQPYLVAQRTSLPHEEVRALWADFIRQSIRIRQETKNRLTEELRTALLEEEERTRQMAESGERQALQRVHEEDLGHIEDLKKLLAIAEEESALLQTSNEELRAQVATQRQRNHELEGRIQSQQVDEVVDREHSLLQEKRVGIETRLEAVRTRLSALEKIEFTALEWMGEVNDLLTRELPSRQETIEAELRLKLPGSSADALAAVKNQITNLQEAQKMVNTGEAYRALSQTREALAGEVRRLEEMMRALELTDHPVENKLMDLFLAKPVPDLNLPDIESLLGESASSTELPTDGQEPLFQKEKITLPDLQFPVEFTEQDRERVVHLETTLNEFLGQDLDNATKLLPYKPAPEKESGEYEQMQYERLVRGITSPSFLDNVSFAIVILGALRNKEGEFVPRVQNQASSVILKKEVGLAVGLLEAAERTSRIFAQLTILGRIRPDLQLIVKKNVGSRFGFANELTQLGKSCAQVWTEKLLEKGVVTAGQLNTIHQTIVDRTDVATQGRVPKKAKKS